MTSHPDHVFGEGVVSEPIEALLQAVPRTRTGHHEVVFRVRHQRCVVEIDGVLKRQERAQRRPTEQQLYASSSERVCMTRCGNP